MTSCCCLKYTCVLVPSGLIFLRSVRWRLLHVRFSFRLQVPSGTMFEVMLYAGSGIVDTVLEWGGLMRAYTKKDQTYRAKDYSINNLG